MNVHVPELTPTQREAVERRKNFRSSIAAKAAELADRHAREALAAIPIAAVEAPLLSTPQVQIVSSGAEIDPAGVNWFVVLASAYRPSDHPSIREIQLSVCGHFNVKLVDMLSSRRTANIVKPRQVAMFLCKNLTPHSLPQIGRRFGGRDHTTVLHGVRKIQSLCQCDEGLAMKVSVLTSSLRRQDQ